MLALLLALISTPTVAPCDAKVQASASKVHAIQAQLFTIPENDTNDYDETTPKIAALGIPALRVELAATEQAYFTCAPSSVSASEAQSSLAHVLHANRPDSETRLANSYPRHTFGGVLKVEVKPVSGDQNLLAADISYSIMCGEDHVLAFFQRQPAGWQRRLDYRSQNPTEGLPTGAFGDMFLYSNVPGPDGEHLIAVAHGHPWCTSRFSGFSLDLIEPSHDNQPQQVIAHEDYSYNRGDISDRITPNPTGFTLRTGIPSEDLNVLEYPGIFRFITTGGKLERTAAASNARDFLEQWLQEKWDVSARWSDSANPHLRVDWDRFQYVKGKHEDVPTIEFGEVHSCTDPGRFQIEMNLPSKLFARVRQGGGLFTMLSFQDKPDPTCNGPLIMKAPQR